jgi:Zn ribbon nucleic-acid-binding protein
MMTNIKNYVDGLDIKEGLQFRSNCPNCGGKNTFTATREDGVVVYNCYKLGCGVRGALTTGLTADEIRSKLRPRDAEPDAEPELLVWPEYVVQPSAEHVLHKKFVQRWGLEHEDLMYDVKDRRSVFPIRHEGRVIDGVGRALDGAIPKWFRYTGNASVYKRTVGKPSGVVLIVEDVISAVTAAKLIPGLTGLAILGTSLNVTAMKHIDGFYKVVVALDPDAAHKTLQFKREVEAWTGLETKALRLDDDIKYKLESDITKLRGIVCT